MSDDDIQYRRSRHSVTSATGQDIQLLHPREAALYNEARDRYRTEYSFTLANDLRTLDRLLLLEVQMYRAQWMSAAGMDYDGVDLEPKEEADLRRTVKEVGAQITETQRDLGLTKSQRDKQSEDSVGGYLIRLKQAAKEHGVMREDQLGRALELTKELFSLVGAFSRSNEEERRKLGFEGPEDILKWISEYMEPEFNAIDEYFRENVARFYRRQL